MKYGRVRSISARQIGRTASSAFCSSVTPHRRSTSPHTTPRSSQRWRISGKTRLTSSSRSPCMSRKVEEMKTRRTRGATATGQLAGELDQLAFLVRDRRLVPANVKMPMSLSAR